MRAERGGSSNLIRSFANKENSFLPGHSPVYHARSRHRRTRRARVAVAGSALRRDRVQRSHPFRDREPESTPAAPNLEPETTLQPRITLPRHLPRPNYRQIDPKAIAAVDPSLEDIPLTYIQHMLQDIGPQLLQATRTATATASPTGPLPRAMELNCENSAAIEHPTHIFAAYSARTGASRCGVTLFPAHALIFAASCAHLPPLPPSDEPSTKPVVPLRLPSPEEFPLLLAYLYTKRVDRLLATLLPAGDDAASVGELAQRHAETFSVTALLNYARSVHGLWNNAAALGVFDDGLFGAVDMAWEVLVRALAIGSGVNLEESVEVRAL